MNLWKSQKMEKFSTKSTYKVVFMYGIWFLALQTSFIIVQSQPQSPLTPGVRMGHQMIYNPLDSELVLYGGSRGGSDQTLLTSIWKFDIQLSQWSQMDHDVEPSARYNHGLVYLSSQHAILVFGGIQTSDYARLNDTWLYDLEENTWTEILPPVAPAKRSDPIMCYDSQQNQVILFGGYGENNHKFNDVWEFNLQNQTWMELNPIHPPEERYGHNLLYRPVDNGVYLFGGRTSGISNELKCLDLEDQVWSDVFDLHTPSARYWHGFIYLNTSDNAFLFGGDNGIDQDGAFDDTWLYDFESAIWTEVQPAVVPPSRASFALCLDYSQDIVYIQGGLGDSYGEGREDQWKFDITTSEWSEIIVETDDSMINGYSGVFSWILALGIAVFIIESYRTKDKFQKR